MRACAAGGQGNLAECDTTEGVLTVAPWLRKGPGVGVLVNVGKCGALVARRAIRQLPLGSGTERTVPTRMTKGVRDR
jgi:hypothetical protein